MKRQVFSAISAISALIVVIPILYGASSVPRFEVDPTFPRLPAGKVLGDMSSVTVDAQDHVWMIHRPATVPAAQRANAAPPVLEFRSEERRVGKEWRALCSR